MIECRAMVIRPSLKFVKLSYVFSLLLAVALGGYILAYPKPADQTGFDARYWGFLLPAVWMFFTFVQHMKKRLVKITIMDDRLRFERGFFSKSTETIDLEKIQEVRVNQTLWQRMVGIGDLMLETAGKSSGNGMESIDNPQGVADYIHSLGRRERAKAQVDPGTGAGPAGSPTAV
jgi:uncharacterized membrane protein YdbT with pleckstrin-like domain